MTRFDKWALVAAAIMGGGFMVALVTIGMGSEPYSQESIERVREMDAEIWANYEAQSAGWTEPIVTSYTTMQVEATQATEDERMTAEHDPDMWLTEIETTEAETEAETEEETTEVASWVANDATESAKRYIFNDVESSELQRLAWAEAGGEGVEAMAHVMRVVLNRVESPDFPNSIPEVITAPGQFTPVTTGAFYEAQPNADTAAALEMVASGWDETYGATYFSSPDSAWHCQTLTYMYSYGNMYFWTYLADH